MTEPDSSGVATVTEPAGRRRAHAAPEPAPSASVEWPYPTCARFCAVPHELDHRCRTAGERVFVAQEDADPESGEARFALVFVEDDERSAVALTAYQASVLLAQLVTDA